MSAPLPIATSPEQELAALVSQVMAMSMLAVSFSRRCIDVHDKEMSKSALDIAQQCIDISAKIPRVVRAHVDATVDQFRPPTPAFYEHVAPTPDQIDALLPAGRGENQVWYVVCVGRNPGLYAAAHDADEEVRGVPNHSRLKVTGRAAALAHYRQMYESGKVRCMKEEP